MVNPFGNVGLGDLFVDHLDAEALVEALTLNQANITPLKFKDSQRFWASLPRLKSDTTREVFEVAWIRPVLVNYIRFDTAHYPHVVAIQVFDEQLGLWRTYDVVTDTWPVQAVNEPEPTTYAALDSVPAIHSIEPPRTKEHPMHTGLGHWIPMQYKVKPIQALKFRIILTRLPTLNVPKNTQGAEIPYSLAVRGLNVGYRVEGPKDIPRTNIITERETFASTADILGSRVSFQGIQYRASNVLQGGIWKSDPQPMPFSVVNFFADTRDSNGDGVLIDRFYVEPTKEGPTVNLYYAANLKVDGSENLPVAAVEASDEPILPPLGMEVHGTSPYKNPGGDYVAFGDSAESFITVNNEAVMWDASKTWWLAFALRPQYDTTDTEVRPIFDSGQFQVWYEDGVVYAATSDGVVNSVEVEWSSNAQVFVSLAHEPADEDSEALFRLIVRVGDQDETVGEVTLFNDFTGSPASFNLMGLQGATPGVPKVHLQTAILKQSVNDDDRDAFFAGHVGYVTKAQFDEDDTHTTDYAIMRFSYEWFLQPLWGLVGGTGDGAYDDVEWTPIANDYALTKGFMHFQPVKARFWKFEFSALAAEQYENFIPVARLSKVFPIKVVDQWSKLVLNKKFSKRAAHPIAKFSSQFKVHRGVSAPRNYKDALFALKEMTTDQNAATPTQAYYVQDPNTAAKLGKSSWLYKFYPWHQAVTSPKFTNVQTHRYELIEYKQQTKVAFFVGLKKLEAYRLDYLVNDDTDQYLEHYHDLENLDEDQTTWEFQEHRMHTADGEETTDTNQLLVSKTFRSFRDIVGVQFATVQTDAHQLLPDDDFRSASLGTWSATGDAGLDASTIDGTIFGGVTVNRAGHRNTWFEVETSYPTYDDLEGIPYIELEGSTEGTFSGGIRSIAVSPGAGGRLYAAARVTNPSETALAAPLKLSILNEDGVVLAESERTLAGGETAEFTLGYTNGTAVSPDDVLTYADLEAMGDYEDLEAGIATPGAPVPTNSGTGGTLGDATYSYRISATNANGETLAGTAGTVVVATGTGTNKVSVPWSAVTGATGYRIYGRTGGSELFLAAVDSATLSWDDDGSRTPAGDLPTTDTTGKTYADLEMVPGSVIGGNVMVQLTQEGVSTDSFLVDTLSLFADPIVWEFSNDDGDTWWPALDIRNREYGLLRFPEPGKDLKYRVSGYTTNLSIAALSIRPWYGGLLSGIVSRFGAAEGLNRNPYDHYRPIEFDPMWRQWDNPVPQPWWNVWRRTIPLEEVEATSSGEVFLQDFLLDDPGTTPTLGDNV